MQNPQTGAISDRRTAVLRPFYDRFPSEFGLICTRSKYTGERKNVIFLCSATKVSFLLKNLTFSIEEWRDLYSINDESCIKNDEFVESFVEKRWILH